MDTTIFQNKNVRDIIVTLINDIIMGVLFAFLPSSEQAMNLAKLQNEISLAS
ncbi:MAG: hypothetical protein JSV76_03240 [Candidatus Bathyarchaeota archaeon]|nr:MAG: hypothetical protein JSV76_03240 [Candidatus Bathyarchaeota archaeon]